MGIEAKFTLTETGTMLRTGHPLYGDIPGCFQYLKGEKEKYGSPASFLIGAVLSCYCETLGFELHKRGAFFRSIEATGRIRMAKDASGLACIESMIVEVQADVDKRYAGILEACIDDIKNCAISRSILRGFPISIATSIRCQEGM